MAERMSASTPVHPRVCGEHFPKHSWTKPRSGSSPRVRGTHTVGRARHERHRFIPACAGNTRSPASVWRRSTVHPRVCGEHHLNQPSTSALPGSSPRVRGTHHRRRHRRTPHRFIPACAGNTPLRRARRPCPSVHPRVCGEHSFRNYRKLRR